jgi:hypothetical protein
VKDCSTGQTAFDVREIIRRLELSTARRLVCGTYQRGVRRAAELEPLKPMPVQPAPRSSAPARIPGLDIRRFIPRRV